MIEIDGEFHMGYDYDWNVSGAMIIATLAEADLFSREGGDPA